MLYFDPENPNKYAALKKELVPHDLVYRLDCENEDLKYEKEKFGKGDGSYVLANCDDYFYGERLFLLSYGIGDDPLGVSFEQSFDNEELGLKALTIHAYDGSIDSLPAPINHTCFFKEYLTKDNFKNHVKWLDIVSPTLSVLKMDVEGCEYEFLTDENLKILADNFDQFTLEVHGLIEESPEGWVYNEQTLEAKKNLSMKVDFFKKLNQHFYLFHIHGNNHAPRYVDFPDSLELTYVNKRICDSIGVSQQRCPDSSVDEPNFDGRPEFILDWWI